MLLVDSTGPLMCQAPTLSYVMSTTAGLYSTFAGVLAGFAFAAIALVVPGTFGRRAEEGKGGADDLQSKAPDSHVLFALLIAFVGLLLATLEYAELAGEQGCALVQGRAASEELLGGVAFSFAVLTLLYALALLIENANVGNIVTEHFRFIVVVLAPPLAILLVGLGAQDISYVPWKLSSPEWTAQSGAFVRHVEFTTELLPCVVLTLCVVVWLTGRGTRKRKPSIDAPQTAFQTTPDVPIPKPRRRWRETPTWFLIYPYLSLGTAIAAVVRATNLGVTKPAAHLSHGEVWGWLFACAVVLTVQSMVLSYVVPAGAGAESGHETEPARPEV
jgi:hypothetical protein